MLNTISKISLPDNTQYDLTTVNRDFPLIVGIQTAATGNWKGIAPTDDFQLRDGQKILYFLNYAGNGNASLQLFKSDGTTALTENLPIYIATSSRLTTHYGVGYFIPLIYRSGITYNGNTTVNNSGKGAWWVLADRNSDTKVTSVGNHYAPSADTNAALSADASSSTAATWDSTSLVTGVNIARDAKGHVTGLTVDSIKMPENPNTDTDIRPSAYCDTNAETAEKTASCTGYSLLNKSWLHVDLVNGNTSQNALTLNVNSKGAKSIYINGVASSSSNYTLPAGTYLVYYQDNIYYFRTDGKIYQNKPNEITINNSESYALSTHGSSFTTVDSITSDNYGRITAINTKTVTLPAQYTPPIISRTDSSLLEDLEHQGTFTALTDITTDSYGKVTAVSTATYTLPSDNDTKVTSSANHYTPETASGSNITENASGATAAWNIDVVQGVTLNTDGKGHVTGMSVTSGKIPGNPNTDRYVNSASFADDTTSNSSNPIKMTLTRAGSDTNTVIGNIPVVSSSSAGVVPKGEAVSTFDQTSKFLRSDGTWVAPKYTTNTNTYTSAYCNTAAGTAAKTAFCSGYTLKNNTYLHVTIVNTNTSKTALTLNVNGKGAKTIYINGIITSSSNYNLGAGTYLVFYDGTNYHFNTNGIIPANSQGWFCPSTDAANATIKTATTNNADLFRLITGVIVAFRFNNGHTASTLAININNTGAKPCAIGGYTAGSDGDFSLQLNGGSVATFMYINSNGGYYRFLGYTTKTPKDEDVEMGTFNFTISSGGLHFKQSNDATVSRRDLVDTSTNTVYNGKGTDCPNGRTDTVKACYTKINDVNGKSTIMIDEEFYVEGTASGNVTFTGLPATPATAPSSYMRYYPVYITLINPTNNTISKTIIAKLTSSTSFSFSSSVGLPSNPCLIRIRTSYRM